MSGRLILARIKYCFLLLSIDILTSVCYNDYAILLIKMGEEYLSLQGVHYSW